MSNKWNFYTSNEIKPQGWLYNQLRIQADGLSGNLDKMWRDVRDSSWIGGDADGWERVPYWLDGFIPLAYLLCDEDMISRAKKYIDAIISYQRPDGWICPCDDNKRAEYDTWVVLLISKVLTVYYECSGDERIPDVLYKTLRNYYDHLSKGEIKLYDWGRYRWFEGFIAINFIYERCKENWLVELAEILKQQGADYNEESVAWKRPLNKWTFGTHIVNIGMMLKAQAVSCDILGENYSDEAEKLHAILSDYNSTPVGLFTGDECLSGLSPIQGTELCAVVEQMYSYEHLFARTGEDKWAQRLEMLAFNALPATNSDDMWTHQYVQMSNQIACEKFPGKSLFRTNGPEAHLFGLEPNFGCCTANFNQGWPKFALSAFMHNENEVISVIPVPSQLRTADKSITVTTNYPFENSVTYDIEASCNFTFTARVPTFAADVKINGEPADGGMVSFPIKAGESKKITLTFDAKAEFIQRPNGLFSVKYGNLVFSVPVETEYKMHEYTDNGVERKFPYCDYELIPKSKWNYAYTNRALTAECRGVDKIPFSSKNPPLVIKAKVKEIDWGYEDGYDTVCAKVPQSTEPLSDEKEIELHPYACAKLRMTELPKL